jgi:modification methylase
MADATIPEHLWRAIQPLHRRPTIAIRQPRTRIDDTRLATPVAAARSGHVSELVRPAVVAAPAAMSHAEPPNAGWLRRRNLQGATQAIGGPRMPPPATPTATADVALLADRAVASPERVPLAVWPCAQTSAQYQRAGRYLAGSTSHPGKMLPELASRLVAEYCPSDGLVVDPMCGIGTTLVEAAALGRHAVGVELEPRWASLARANLTRALSAERASLAEVRQGDARRLPELLQDVAGRVDLVVTSPPYACDAGVIDKPAWRAGHPMCPRDTLNYSRDPGNLGHTRGQAWRSAIAEVLAGCAWLLRPGGLLVTVTKNSRRAGRLSDLAATTVRLAEQAGFGYLQHLIALHAAVRDGRLAARPSFWQLTQIRKARARGEPAHLVVHEDVLVFKTAARPMGADG